MEVKKGYKQTEVGVIPEGWDVATGLDITTMVGKGASPRWQGFNYSNAGMLFITSENVRDGFLDLSKPKYLPLAFHEKIKRTKLQKDDILINLVGASIGRSCQITCELGEANVNQAVAVFRVKEQHWTPFIAYYFQSPATVERILDMQVDAARPNVSLSNLRGFAIPLPPLPEQRAIAATLSDANALISSLEKLIAKKRNIKQGAMQQLLTGKKRLPGFSGKWEMKKLGEVLKVKHGKSQKEVVDENGEFPILATGGVIGTANTSIYNKPSVLIGRKGTIDLPQYMETPFWAIDTIFYTEILGNNVPKFIFYKFNLIDWYSYNEASGVPSLNAKTIENIESIFPPIVDEQIEIGAILSDMEAEIEALEQKLDKYKMIKQGMMQELLTGRIRLIQQTEVAKPMAVVMKASETADASFKRGHNWQINEAVVISVLTSVFGSEQYPLGRKRYTKFSYLLHRHVEGKTEGYRKKAAGPYNPDTKYKGPEKIAQNNRYIKPHTSGKFSGFIVDENIERAKEYFEKWYGCEVLPWLEQFRYENNEQLELLTTVDMAVYNLMETEKVVSVSGVKGVIRSHPEWKTKLNRPIFLDENIDKAIKKSQELFGTEGL